MSILKAVCTFVKAGDQTHSLFSLSPVQQLTGERATPDHACALLERHFSDPRRKAKTTVLLADEVRPSVEVFDLTL